MHFKCRIQYFVVSEAYLQRDGLVDVYGRRAQAQAHLESTIFHTTLIIFHTKLIISNAGFVMF